IIQQDLAISVVKDKATIARALELMEKQNIIVRIKDEKDKRNKKIFLTHKGRQLQHQVLSHGDSMMGEIDAMVSKEEMQTCLAVLSKVYYNLKDKL
ncbi:MAG: MarR family transcriptional regulator, partial [Bacteroidota bacterium]